MKKKKDPEAGKTPRSVEYLVLNDVCLCQLYQVLGLVFMGQPLICIQPESPKAQSSKCYQSLHKGHNGLYTVQDNPVVPWKVVTWSRIGMYMYKPKAIPVWESNSSMAMSLKVF